MSTLISSTPILTFGASLNLTTRTVFEQRPAFKLARTVTKAKPDDVEPDDVEPPSKEKIKELIENGILKKG
ncbi:unnamed protein product [Brassica oleracea var. botrytis]